VIAYQSLFLVLLGKIFWKDFIKLENWRCSEKEEEKAVFWTLGKIGRETPIFESLICGHRALVFL
jgi:hypothetical protein